MTLGDQLKQQRTEQSLSQAELAERMGIEQSYLSKLESDRSLPSNDMLKLWLNALETDLDAVISTLDNGYVHGKLRQIPMVDEWLREHSQRQHKRRTSVLVACALSIALAFPLFYLGFTAQLLSETMYEYESPGIVMPGENMDVFRNRAGALTESLDFDPLVQQRRMERMNRRQNIEVKMLPEYRGTLFNEPVSDDGNFTRTYYFQGEVTQSRTENALLQAFGLFLLVLGLVGFWLERRLHTK
ncbi:MAG: helix-turn-helix domain-containing protein [Idiomarina sp.]|nr:helix-turn-helix domain-containing protein [Idiomarina sp.]